MSVLLSVQGLTKGYGPRPLFSDLSLDLRAGERVGLIGPNGSGKSTLLRLLAGREEPDAGVRSLRRTARLGYVAQDDVFPAGRSVRDVLLDALAGETLEEHERDTRAAITLTQVGFTDPAQAADVLSGGWRKRLRPGPGAGPPARPAAAGRADESPRFAGRRLAGAAVALRPVRLRRRHPRPRLPAGGGRRDRGDQPRLPRRLFPRPGSYDQFADRREEFLEAQARREEAVANQVRRETEWLSPQGVGPAQQVGLADRGRRQTAAGIGGAEISQLRGRRGRHRLRGLRPADAQAAHRDRRRQGARRPAALLRPGPGAHAGEQARPARRQRQRQEHAAARAGRRDSTRRRGRGAGRRASDGAV